jgi:hypothetical protein
MKLLTNRTTWLQWIKEEEGRFADTQHPEPKKYPCFGYMELVSWGQETLKPIYLYQHDLESMAIDLITAQRS